MRPGDPRRFAFLAVSLVVAILARGTPAIGMQRYAVTPYTNADGLPQAQVLSVFQDSQGYMWLGTYGGVARYDGVEYKTLSEADGLVGNVVYAIEEGRDGRMFFGTGEGVTILADGNLSELKGPDGGSIRAVRKILTDTRRERWIATADGLYRERNSVVDRFGEADGLPSSSIFAVTRDTLGYLWAGTERGLARLTGNRFASVGEGLPPGAAVRALVTRGPELWVGTDAGIFRSVGEVFRPVEAAAGAPPTTSSVVDAALDPSGNIWFATLGGVVGVGEDDRAVVAAESLTAGNSATAVAADREGNVWFGTDNGVSKLVPGPFEGYSERDGLPHNFVRGLAEGDDGRIWVATRGGVGVMETDGRIWSIRRQDGLTDERVYAVAPISGDRALFGTPTGLFYYADGGIDRLTTANGLPSDNVRALLHSGDERVWIGTDDGLAIWEDGRIRAIPQAPRIGRLDIFALVEEESSGKLWIATRDNGVAVYGPDGFERRGQSLGLEQVELWTLASDWEGGMWVGTNGRGAYRISDTQTIRLSTNEGLANDFVWQVISDGSGRVWFYTNRGLDRWDGDSIRHYDLADGLIDLEGSANSALQDRSSNLWFGTGHGLAKYVPELEPAKSVAPLVQLQQVTVGGTPVPHPPGETIEIDYARGAIAFTYAGLSFHDERSVRYRHRLLGLSDEWSLPSTDRGMSFAQLPPGRYTFEVVASNGRSTWSSSPASVTFWVKPAWFQRADVRAVTLVLLGFAVLGAYLWRQFQQGQEKEKLERMVAKRTDQLMRSEERMRTALRNSPTFVFSQNRELRYTWVHNPIMGLQPEQVLGARDADIMEPDAARVLTEIKRRVLDSGIGTREEVSLCRDAEHCSFDVSIEPLRDNGVVVGITGAAWDVTQQRNLEGQLRHAQKMEVVGRLAGGVAHDFNNLLTGITGYTELGLGHLPPNSAVEADFRQVLKCTRRAAELTQQLLAFSRLQPLEPTVVDLDQLVKSVSSLLVRLIGEDITLQVAVEEGLHAAFLDRSQIEQVLVNLAVNARDAMPNGGELRITTENVAVDRALAARYRGLVPGDYVRVVVADTGSGMSSETREHAFEPFFTTKEVGKGTGLGLATVYGIIKQHEGYVYVDSELGAGTSFSLFLQPTSEEVTPEESVDAPLVPGGRETILLVEDEDTVREVTERWLQEIGYTVYAAARPDLAENVYRAHASEIDLLLTDVVMPEMSGPELYRRLRDCGGPPRVLYMSGYPDRGTQGRKGLERPEPFIQKPFALERLADSVRSVLDAQAPPAEGQDLAATAAR